MRSLLKTVLHLPFVCVWMTAPLCLFSLSLSAAEHPGKLIYQNQCAGCHGARGEGVPTNYPAPLVGDLSVKELTTYIAAAMPEGEPELCVAEDAEAVAQFIHEDFYSIIAQVRNQPPKIDMSRLTVRQYRNSLTDLAESFTWQTRLNEKRGLRAEYYKSRRRNKENRVIERVDPTINFDFGTATPDAEKIPVDNPDELEFSINWTGGLIAPDTGWYEIILDMENGGRLWLNDRDTPLIDVRVKSGDQTEYREPIFLLGGRVYSLRLEYYKSKPEKQSAVALKWVRPGGVVEVVAERYLSPENYNRQIIIETDFPPDDKSVGYERGISISQEWQSATAFGAIEFADELLADLKRYVKLPKEKDQQVAKLKAFCVQLAGRAFRRPLTEQQAKFFVDRQFDDLPDDPLIATKRVILLTLTSPRFLFPGSADAEWDDFRVANWLALALWDSLPDEQLRKQAERGQLNTPQQIQAQAERMSTDQRARAKTHAFFHQWLHFEHFAELSKSMEAYPDFTKQVAADLKTSLDLFIEDVVWSEGSDYRQLLLANDYYMNGRLAQFYGVDLPAEADFQKVAFEPDQRSGLVSHPLLLAGLAYEAETSPIHRGVFVARSLLGRFLKPPPIAIAPEPAELHPNMTMRQRVEKQTAATMCSSCHGMINPLGFALENFDSAGRFQQKDHGQPIDSSGIYIDRSGQDNQFAGARGLAQFLVTSDEAHNAFSEQLFQYLIKQPVQAFGAELQNELKTTFVEQNFHIQKLLADIAAQSALTAREMSKK